jgi:hypothetical protein
MFDLARVQRGLETLYRIDLEVRVEDFLISDEVLDQFQPERRPREQLLLSQEGEVGLFVCDTVLRNLAENDPSASLDEDNLADFLLAVEGVSHFVYLAWRARADQPVSALELELQAEVDKYVSCVLVGACHRAMRRRLFFDFDYEPDLDATERSRYAEANRAAASYTARLERDFLSRNRVADMLTDLRRFYRLPVAAKLAAG